MGGSKSKRGGGERVLESRHLIGLFLGVVLLCCVFFTLGYVMGKTQYGNSPVEAASLAKVPPPSSAAQSASAQTPPQSSPEWDFYTDKKTSDIPLRPAPAASQASNSWHPSGIRNESAPSPHASAVEREPARVPSSRSSASTPARFRPPRIPRGAIVLQVGALRSESDAQAMAGALQGKGFPAFVVVPSADNFYRVQVGPFAAQAAGDRAKQALERIGFKSIYKR